MKKTFLMALCMVLTEGGVSFTNIHDSGKAVSAQIRSREPTDTAELKPKLNKLKVSFINNQGQADKRVKFYAHTVGGTVFITDDGKIVYSFLAIENEKPARGFVLKEELVDGNVARVKGERKAITNVNYFKGNDPSKWKRNLPTYDIVSLGQVYKGIELKLKADGNNVEKLFYVKAGAQPERIRLKVNGRGLNVNKTGDLEIRTEHGTVRMTKPVAYQERRGKKEFVEVAYVVKGDEYGFELGEYDRRKDIIIDPILAATYLGGSWNDFAYAIALDGNGNVYVAGTTEWSDFPGIGAGSADSVFVYPEEAFVAKLDSSLSTILAVTFLGGSAYETAYAIALDSKGNVYVAGGTNSSDFPGVGAGSADSTNFSGEAFVAKLDSSLGKILNATFLGGSQFDYAQAIAIDGLGNIYVAGATFSPDFPGVGPGSADSILAGSTEAFIAKLDSNLSSILAATFLGGGWEYEGARAIALDSKGNVYVTGRTFSPDFPGVGPGSVDSTYVDTEAFVAKLDSNLSSILAATFLGGNYIDDGRAIALDSKGNIYVAGSTVSSDFPGVGAGSADSTNFSGEAFVAKLAFEEPARFEYAAKIVCGVQKDPKDMRLARGFYATAINIHNPNDSDVKFLKKLALTFPPAVQSPGKVMPISEDKLGPDEALEVDCEELRRRLFPKGFPTPYIKGFVVIRSPESLDVTAVYTTATLDRKGQAADHSSIHVEQIRERKIGRQQAKPEMIPD